MTATGQPAARPAGPSAAPDRRSVRPGALRRHRRPVPQEGDAGDLRPGQPRPAAAGLQPGRLRPARLGRPGLRPDRARLGQGARPHRVPRGGLAAARRGVPVRAGRLRRRRRLRPRCAAPSRSSTQPRGTGGNHAFYLSIPPRFFGDVVEQLKEHGLADGPARAPGGGWSSRSRSGTTWSRRASSTTSSTRSSRRGSVFRIDHYLGKETVQNILAMRFANDAVRADLELQLRRPRADHDGRGHRHRRPRRLLRRHRRRPRRHPEPPAPADGAGGDGGADVVRRREPAASRS